MRVSHLLAAAFTLSIAALCQLPAAAQSVPVDCSVDVAPECEPINVTASVLGRVFITVTSFAASVAACPRQGASLDKQQKPRQRPNASGG